MKETFDNASKRREAGRPMKKFILLFSLVISLILTQAAFAQQQKKSSSAAAEAPAVSTSSSSGSGGSFGLGLSTIDPISGATSSGSLTMLLELGDKGHLQTFLSIPSTSPFAFSLGGLYKHSISGTQDSGFHVGGGFHLGIAGGAVAIGNLEAAGGGNDFGFGFAGVAGLHFPVAHKVQIHLDAGPVVNITGGSARFNVAPFSGLLGASAVYMF